MTSFVEFVRTFGADESGATAVEYGLIVAGLSAVVAGAVATVGESIQSLFLDTIAVALG